MNATLLRVAVVVIAAVYSLVHIVVSGVLFALDPPNVGQVVEELQPLYRLFTTGAATVDHPRQYGPVFLLVFHPVYRFDLDDHTLLSRYAYAVDVVAILVAFAATWDAIRTWATVRGVQLNSAAFWTLAFLWANFSPLYAVLVIKNVELWELALLSVAVAALMRGRRWVTGTTVAAAALVKMLPLVYVPYLLLRDRRTFVYTIVALGLMATVAQMLYGTAMGWGYLPAMVRAALGGESFGFSMNMMWHENVSLRGVVWKAFGFLTFPDPRIADPLNAQGFFVRIVPGMERAVSTIALVLAGIAGGWTMWTLIRRARAPEPGRTFWDWALVGIMMLVLAPQISQDYMVLTLGAFSFVLAGCFVYGTRRMWVEFALAVLLVGNILPRGVFARFMLIDPLMSVTGYTHLTRAEAYQYFCFPLLGLLLLVRVWNRVAECDDRAAVTQASA